MNLNKEERLEQIRNILIGSQIGSLEEKVTCLEKDLADKSSQSQFEERINELEKFIYEEISSLKQFLGLEQAKREKADEHLQKLQTASQDLTMRLSKLEKKVEQSQNLQSSELAEIRGHFKSLQLGLGSQEVENKNTYEQLQKGLQEYADQWNLKLSELEQKTLGSDQVLQRLILEYSKQSSNELEKFKEDASEYNKALKNHFLTQLHEL